MTSHSSQSEAYVPIVDFTPLYTSDARARDRLAGVVERVCRTSGFLLVRGHRVPDDVLHGMLGAVERFFAQPAAMKLALVGDSGDPLQRGYIPLTSGGAEVIAPDLHECFIYNRFGDSDVIAKAPEGTDPRLLLPNRLPDIPGFVDAYRAYYAELERLAMDIMRLFARILALPDDWFDEKFDNHTTGLAANYYPPQEARPDGQVRKAAHSDWGTVTILYQDAGSGGLQVLTPDREWVDVPPVPGTFVVNLGELMTLWTNDRWSSTVHRVISPPPHAAIRPRYSLAFFHQPNHDALIECIPTCVEGGAAPRHQPVVSYDYFALKARRAHIARQAVFHSAPSVGEVA